MGRVACGCVSFVIAVIGAVAVALSGAGPVQARGQAIIHFDTNGRPPQTRSGDRTSPVTVVLVLDLSPSMTWPPLDPALRMFANNLRPEDEATLITLGSSKNVELKIDRNTSLHLSLDTQREDRADEVGGPSPVWDAIDRSLDLLESATNRRGIVVLTDGRSTGNRVGLESVKARAVAMPVPIMIAGDHDVPVTIGQTSEGFAQINPGWLLAALAKATGGHYLRDPRDPKASASNRHPGPQLVQLLKLLQSSSPPPQPPSSIRKM